MKNKFGFIPIVLPVLVMVLIIGLINLAGPQNAQAQAVGNVDEVDARLSALSLTVGTLSPAFAPDVANYTAMVDNSVTSVTVNATQADDTNFATPVIAATGASTDVGTLGVGVTTITVTVAETTPSDPPKTATYVIRLTRRAPDVNTNGPRLTAFAISGVTLAGKYGATAFDAGVGSYVGSVNYNVQSVTVTATPADGVTATISPSSRPVKDVNGDPQSPTEHRVRLNVGENRITVSTQSTGGNDSYTVVVTRQAPEVAGITIPTTRAGDTDPTIGTFNGDTRTYEVELGYEVDSTTVEVDVTGADRRVLKSVTPADMDGSTADVHDVKIASGQTRTVVISVDQWLATEDLDDAATVGSTSTGEYRVMLMRAHPKLAAATDTPVGLVLTYGVGTAPTGAEGMLDPVYDADTTAYKATVPYQWGFVTISPTAQTAMPPGDTLEAVLTGRHSADARPGITGYQVELDAGVTKTVTVTVRSKANPSSAKRDYTIALTRDATPLDTLALCEGVQASCDAPVSTADGQTAGLNGDPFADGNVVDPQIGLMPSGTSTPHEFNPSTTTYTASVDYAVSSVTVSANNTQPDPPTNREISISTSSAGYKAVELSTANLVVGDNDVAVRSGIPGNTSTYEVTVMREDPKPTLRFVLLDGDGERLGDGAQELRLDAQTRNYNFDEMDVTNASFEDDDLIMLSSLRVYTDVLDAGVRVSYDQVTVNETEATALPIPSLPEGNFTLEFEVRYLTGVGNEEDSTTHRISFVRPENSQPVFPANDPLRGQQITLLHNEEFRPTGTNRVIELPFASGGDGTLDYELIGNEAKGSSKDLPSNLSYDKPTNSPDEDGEVTGIPMIVDASDAAVHHLILRVWDDDAIEGADDEDTIEFSIRIVRDASQITPGPSQTADLAELFDIEVKYDDPVTTDATESIDAKLNPEFDPDRKIYVATVPTDVDQVDIHITASSTATVRLNNTGAPDDTEDVSTDYGTGTRHEWNGHRLSRGRVITVPNRYTIDVSDGGVDMAYTLDVVREANTAPELPVSQYDTLKYYEGIPVGGASALKAVTLPRPLKASGGNGATSSWEYSLDRRLSTAQDLEGFLGLEFDAAASKRTLSGTPILDTARTRPDRRLSDHSEVYAEYSVQDYDLDRGASDMDTLHVDIFVYRNATLRSLTVDGSRVDLTDSKEVLTYRDSRLYSYNTEGGNYIPEYTQSLAHDATMATISVDPYLSDSEIAVAYSVADADPNTSGHQVPVSKGDNLVTVTVSNATISVRHVINLSVPGLEAESITVIEDEDARVGGAEFLNKDVKLVPNFDRRQRDYTATVETWVRSVRVSAVPVDSRAQVQVNDFALPDAEGYRVVNLPNIGDTPNPITVGMHLGDATPVIYNIDVTRKADTAPAFPAGGVPDRVCLVDNSIKYPIQLPMATGGNGALTYSVIDEDLPSGLIFNATNRQITGTPRLDEGYSSDFMVTYMVGDADGNDAASDKDTRTFTITITNDPNAPCAQPDPQDEAVDPADRNTLSDLIVTYDKGSARDIVVDLVPPFSPRTGGPYTANVPPDATNIQVETVPAVTEARITINNTRIAGGEKLNLPPQATIVVTHAALSDAMTYTLNTVRDSDDVPEFDDEVASVTLEASMAIEDPIQLPMASGGNAPLRYSLMDHEGGMPEGLTFNASTREISGTPVLLRDAVRTVYQMTYTVMDAQNQSASLKFMITVCDASDMGCEPTMAEPNPGATPVELTVARSSGSTSATINWRPGDDAAMQLVAAVDLSDIVASINATVATVPGDADEHTFAGLSAGVSYTYLVIGLDANGGYMDPSTPSGISGMVVSE